MSGFVRDHINLYADIDVEFNSLSEDHQDLAYKLPKKQMRFWEGTGLDLPLQWNVESHKEKYFFVTIKISFD